MKFPKFFTREVKASAAGVVMVRNPGQPIWTPRQYDKFADEAYAKNVIAYSAISRVASAVASVEFEVWQGDKELSAHPLLDLIARPNMFQSFPEFVREKISYHLIAGNSYDERVQIGGVTREIYSLRPDRMKVLESNTGMPGGYVYEVGGKKTRWDADPVTGESDIRHMKAFNPLNDWYGQSPVESGAYAVDQHNEAMAYVQALLQNGATPTGALVSSETLTPDQFAALKAQMEERHQGSANAGRPLLLEGGLDWKQMGVSPQNMQVLETKNAAARDIALAFGVPPMLLGIPGDNTYANYKEARLAFWEDTVLPLVGYMAREWTNWLGEGTVEIRPNFEKIPAIVEKSARRWEMADKSTDLTINERRALKGYDDLKSGGDVVLVNAGLIPVEEPEGGVEGITPTGDVQRQALNGAQMSSIQGVIEAVASGMIPASSAIQMLKISFPSMTSEEAGALIDPANGFEQDIPDIKSLAEIAGYAQKVD